MTEQYGMWCYGCKEGVEVDLIDGDVIRAHQELEDKAREAGWGMGLVASGEAFYSCADCGPCLYNFNRFQKRRVSSVSRPTQNSEAK